MIGSDSSLTREVVIKNELGIHARPASRIAEIARKARSRVWFIKNHEKVDASSIIDLLSIEGRSGSKIIIKIDDKLDIGVLNSIVQLIEKGFEE
jgi:phosphocarrier protein